MSNSDFTGINRRKYLRAKMAVDFCACPCADYYSITPETGCPCFITSSVDISIGGICLHHKSCLSVDDIVELRTKNVLTNQLCITCEKILFMKTTLQLQPISAKVIWISQSLAGLQFLNLTVRNENIITKAVWDSHISAVRKSHNRTF